MHLNAMQARERTKSHKWLLSNSIDAHMEKKIPSLPSQLRLRDCEQKRGIVITVSSLSHCFRDSVFVVRQNIIIVLIIIAIFAFSVPLQCTALYTLRSLYRWFKWMTFHSIWIYCFAFSLLVSTSSTSSSSSSIELGIENHSQFSNSTAVAFNLITSLAFYGAQFRLNTDCRLLPPNMGFNCSCNYDFIIINELNEWHCIGMRCATTFRYPVSINRSRATCDLPFARNIEITEIADAVCL